MAADREGDRGIAIKGAAWGRGGALDALGGPYRRVKPIPSPSLPQPHNANPESSYPRVPQRCGSNWGYGDEICLLASSSSSECSLVCQWRFWTSIWNFQGAREGFEEVLDWERPGRAIGRAASFWFPHRPTPATHGRAGASPPGPPKDEARRFQRVFQFEFHCWNR